MCGIAGLWEAEARGDQRDPRAIVETMTATMAHRGPDGEGIWGDPHARLALGSRRLSIVDLSDGGRQPMASSCGRFVLVANGELYNHRELRKELENGGARFRGHCDTEVMLASVASWGLERALARFVGMFAFALWDGFDRTLHLVRDRFGEKPLYYGWLGGALVFASELKALRVHPEFDAQIDLDALGHYLRYSYVPVPASIYRGVRKLPAGTRLSVSQRQLPALPTPTAYWSLREVVQKARRDAFRGPAEEAVETLDGLLQESVKLRMEADVPVGAFLSGGLDSSTLVSMMTRRTGTPVRTFSIGLADSRLDEAPAARAIGQHLGTEHAEWYIGPTDARAVIPELASIYDEPFGDASAIPLVCVSRLASRSCKATVAGDGADELLGGYERYAVARGIWNRTRSLPARVRRTLGRALGSSSNERLMGIGRLLGAGYPSSIHWHLVSHWKGACLVVPDGLPDRSEHDTGNATSDFPTEMLYLDAVTLLPDDLLVKVDRASMSTGLEVRLPFLDPAVVEFCFRLSHSLRTRRGHTKWILRRVLQRYLPDPLIAVEKRGFAVPLATWLRGPLRDWAEDRLGVEHPGDRSPACRAHPEKLARALRGNPRPEPRPLERPHVPGLESLAESRMTSATEHEAAARRPVRILSVSCVYPTSVEPRRGLFIRSRLLALATFAKLSIVAPVGLVQWGAGGARRWGASNPSQRSDGGVHVLHPRWLYPPNAGWANGFLLFLQVLPVLLRLRRRFRWEVIDAHYGHPEGVAAALSAMVFRCRYTVTLRGAEMAHVRRRLRRRVLGWSLRRAARVIALSGELRELALTLGVPRQRIVVVTNGVDGDLFRPRPRDESRARLGLDPRLRLVLTVGRQVAEKGHVHVLDAMRPLFDGDPELRLAMAGGPGRTGSGFERELRRRLDAPQLRARVMLLGEIAQDELTVWMNAADVFCLGSLREGCPNVVLEALACGVPVVATKVGAVPELVPSEEFGLVVPAADPAALERALRRALAGNWDRAAISAWGRSRSWLHVAEELRAVFADVSESA